MEQLLVFKSFLDELSKDNSRLYKMEVLKNFKDNDIVKYILNFVFNPYIVTGISDKKLKRDIRCDENDKSATLMNLLEYLKVHNTGRDEDIAKVRYFEVVNLHNDCELIDLLRHIITKNLTLGIDALTINKCIPNLIPTFNVMLANKYFEKPEYVEGKEFALTTKIDGGRIIALKENGVVSFYTRAGQKYEGLVDLEKEMKMCMPDNICLDGEITLLDKGNLTSKEQYKETMKITRKDGEKHGVKMLVFDFMPVEDFINQHSSKTYKERRRWLSLLPKVTYFEVLPILYKGTDTNEITKWLNYNIEHGEEGVMINIYDAPYEFKRTNNLLKVKKMNDIDLPILDFEEGKNRHQGKLGAIITEYKGHLLKVGGGFSDELREEIWQNKDKYRGMMMSVQYFEETTNQEGGISLRFPVFLDFRPDLVYNESED